MNNNNPKIPTVDNTSIIKDEVIPPRLIAFALISSTLLVKKVSGWVIIQTARTKRSVIVKTKNRAAAQILR